MKRYLTIIAIGLLALSACKERIEGELGTPFDKVAGMHGKWELASFTQTDLNNPVNETRNLSHYYLEGAPEAPVVELNVETMQYGTVFPQGKNYFGEGGTWELDDPSYPSEFLLYTGLDTIVFDLGAVVRPFDNKLKLQTTKGCSGVNTVIYSFEFNRIEEE